MPYLPRLALMIGAVGLMACAGPAPTTSAPPPPEDVVTWRDSDGCWRALPRPGEAVNLIREVDQAGNIICPDIAGPAPAAVANVPEATLPIPVAASEPEVIRPAEPLPEPIAAPAPAPEQVVATMTEATPGSPMPVARPATTPPATTAPAPAPEPGPSGRFVQVGAFGEPANVTRNKRNFDLAGIPTVTREARAGSRALTLLQLGPFPSAESAETALEIARSAGFADAFIVTID
ncbi:cell division septation protein DedD [Rubricella aquisinus]|uniref:Cell division septation protein DedD n=1 Tax=Rubricella aquisinus TaxID=2028108 RepID=A0A840WWH2_9RHOB|nr:SPOR domain-containing protein [Rubricella aquisinus]MBB5515530.1 cell division septation protein DedD [Rubricella aquisinus]